MVAEPKGWGVSDRMAIGMDTRGQSGWRRTPFQPRVRATGSDRVFGWVTTGAGIWALVLLGLVGLFLVIRAWPAFQERGWAFFTTVDWRVDLTPPQFGVAGLLYGTVVVALVAMV